MTQEQKAKAYDEALERARELIAKWTGKNKDFYVEDYAYIFPELRESEDERVIKALETFINQPEIADKITFEARIEWLSWLEKQKEPNKEELVYRLNGLMQEYIKEAKDQEEEEHRFKCYKLFWDALEDTSYFEQKEPKQTDLPAGFYYIDLDGNKYYSKEFRYGDMKVKVGEQKPVEWKLPDDFEEAVYKVANFISPFNSQEELRKVSHRFAEQLLDIAKKEQKPADISNLRDWKFIVDAVLTEHEGIGQYLDKPETERVAKKLQERFSLPQSKPAEWSEEDERIVKFLEWMVKNHTWMGDVSRESAMRFLKDLRPQPKQEWSKEDENMLWNIISIVGQSKSIEADEMLNWLKSLRSRPKSSDNWKPSEEQMKALNFAITYFMHETNYKNPAELRELYDDLLKLK